MSKLEKILDKVLRGTSDANIDFEDLRHLLNEIGFHERIQGAIAFSQKMTCWKSSTCSLKARKPSPIR